MDPYSAPLWNKYIEYEERMEEPGKIIALLFRAIQLPSFGNQDHFNRLRHMASYRPIAELLPAADAVQYLQINPAEVLSGDPNEQKIRGQIDQYYYAIFYQNQTEMTRRKDFESHIERPYFTTDEINDGDFNNWDAYLDFEEAEGNYERTRFLYERCLVACAYYDYFWARFYRWTIYQTKVTTQPWGNYSNTPPDPEKHNLVIKAGQEETVRNIFRRASYYVPVGRTTIRMMWANWEESIGCVGTADAIYDTMVETLPDFTEAVVDRALLQRRHNGIEAGLQVFRDYIGNRKIASNLYSKGWIVAEWAKLIWKANGDAESARDVFAKSANYYLDVKKFWITWLQFELEVPTTTEEEQKEHHARLKALVHRIRTETRIPPHTIKDLCQLYLDYLKERCGPDAMAEYVELDFETYGPFSAQTANLIKLAPDGKIETTRRRMYLEAGHPGVAVNDPLVSRGHNPYAALYRDQGENPYDAGRDPLRIGHGHGQTGGHGHGPYFPPHGVYQNSC